MPAGYALVLHQANCKGVCSLAISGYYSIWQRYRSGWQCVEGGTALLVAL